MGDTKKASRRTTTSSAASKVKEPNQCPFCPIDASKPFTRTNNLTQHLVAKHSQERQGQPLKDTSDDALEAIEEAIILALRVNSLSDQQAAEIDRLARRPAVTTLPQTVSTPASPYYPPQQQYIPPQQQQYPQQYQTMPPLTQQVRYPPQVAPTMGVAPGAYLQEKGSADTSTQTGNTPTGPSTAADIGTRQGYTAPTLPPVLPGQPVPMDEPIERAQKRFKLDIVMFRDVAGAPTPTRGQQFAPSRLNTRKRNHEAAMNAKGEQSKEDAELEETEINVEPGEKFGFQMRATFDETVVVTFAVVDKSTGAEHEKNNWILDPANRKTQPIFLRVGNNPGVEQFSLCAYALAKGTPVPEIKNATTTGVPPSPASSSSSAESEKTAPTRGERLYRAKITCFVGQTTTSQ